MKVLPHSFYIRSTRQIWFIIGLFILYKGFLLSVDFSLLREGRIFFQPRLFAWLFFGFFVGFLKGHFVLKKTAQRIQKHILIQPLPLSLRKIYPLSYLFLMGSMLGIAVCFKFLPMTSFYRGIIDLAIGSALITGSFFILPNKD